MLSQNFILSTNLHTQIPIPYPYGNGYTAFMVLWHRVLTQSSPSQFIYFDQYHILLCPYGDMCPDPDCEYRTIHFHIGGQEYDVKNSPMCNYEQYCLNTKCKWKHPPINIPIIIPFDIPVCPNNKCRAHCTLLHTKGDNCSLGPDKCRARHRYCRCGL